MGKVKSGARTAKPKQRRKRQIDVKHETGSPSGVDTRHALLTAISTRGFAAYFQPVNNGESGWIVASIFDFGLGTDVRLSTIRFLVLEFLCCRGSYFYPAYPDSTKMGLKENLTGSTKNPSRSPPAEVFWLRQMIFRPSLAPVFS